MRPPLSLTGCFVDSPANRKQLNVSEDSLALLDTSIKNLLKFTRSSMDLAADLCADSLHDRNATDPDYSSKNASFAQDLTNFAGFNESKEDPEIENALGKFGDTLKEIERSRTMMISHMSDVFIDPIERFSKEEIAPVKEFKKKFDQSSDNYDNSTSRYLSKKPKDLTINESAKEVEVARKDFHEKYLDYSIKMNELHAKKKFEFMEYVLAMMYTQFAFFHQGYELLRDLEPFMRDLTSKLHESRTVHQQAINKVKDSKTELLAQTASCYNPLIPSPNTIRETSAITKSGYLYKKGSGRMVQPWSKRFFSIEGELLVYSTRGKDEEPTVAINLRVCTVKPTENLDRRFCFEIISPQRTFLLQAHSDEEVQSWILCLQNAIKAAFHGANAASEKGLPESAPHRNGTPQPHHNGHHHNQHHDVDTPARLVDTVKKTEADPAQLLKVRSLDGNDVCAECNNKDAVWASINLGIALCIECSGIHRSLGVHFSKVRSLALDKWEPESVEVMLRLGNVQVNKIYEATLDDQTRSEKRPTPTSERGAKLKWITAKYVKKEFVGDGLEFLADNSVHLEFWRSIAQSDLSSALRYLALGANVNFKNEDRNSTTPLHQAILSSDNVAVEFLFQWGCDSNAIDADGWSPLHHAAATNNLRLVLSLLKRHAKCDLKDKLGKTPVDIATEQEHVQIVTTLRMFQFEQQEERANAGRPTSYGYSDAMGGNGGGSHSNNSSRNPTPDGRGSLQLTRPTDLSTNATTAPSQNGDRKNLQGNSANIAQDAEIPLNGTGAIVAGAAAAATRFAANFKMPQFSKLHEGNAYPATPFVGSSSTASSNANKSSAPYVAISSVSSEAVPVQHTIALPSSTTKSTVEAHAFTGSEGGAAAVADDS